ncbi:TetR/AcrR family transcriptional regulator [Comamonas composti]|uniref:TetR/AcrR family transcriptional regulator n=1 Tax=Comamonas composti TaxID=408558 RepID=UPI00041B2677|nr:TetR/AcrR family transcriptional regulator [Comamonas composti]
MAHAPDAKKTAVAKPRRYLSSSERKREILDAALLEFMQDGYAASTVERIAARAGLSKSGIYAHYQSKEQIFEELLTTALLSSEDSFGLLLSQTQGSLHEIVDAYIDQIYSRLESPLAVSTFQLLIAEGRRAPRVIERWNQSVLMRMSTDTQKLVEQCVARGIMRKSVLSENFFVIISPFVFWLAKSVLLGEDAVVSLSQVREIHRQLMLEILLPR